MRIVVLGATGRTGRHVVEAVVQSGHTAVAIARNPAALKGLGAEVVEGTPYDGEIVDRAMAGADAVVNTLNVSRTSDNPWAKLRAPRDMISKSASNALEAMKREGCNRFVAMSTIGAGSSRQSAPAILRFIVAISNLKLAFEDHSRQENLLIASNVDFTVVRAPMLSDGESAASVKVVREGSGERLHRHLSRKSAARFFVDIIENRKYLREVVGVSDDA